MKAYETFLMESSSYSPWESVLIVKKRPAGETYKESKTLFSSSNVSCSLHLKAIILLSWFVRHRKLQRKRTWLLIIAGGKVICDYSFKRTYERVLNRWALSVSESYKQRESQWWSVLCEISHGIQVLKPLCFYPDHLEASAWWNWEQSEPRYRSVLVTHFSWNLRLNTVWILASFGRLGPCPLITKQNPLLTVAGDKFVAESSHYSI